jgi:hypothetical protein
MSGRLSAQELWAVVFVVNGCTWAALMALVLVTVLP